MSYDPSIAFIRLFYAVVAGEIILKGGGTRLQAEHCFKILN